AHAISGNRVGEPVKAGGYGRDAGVEQELGCAGLEHRGRAGDGLDGNRHQFAVRTEEVQLLAVAAPAWKLAPGDRYLPLRRPGGKRTHVDLILARFVRGVGDPVAVRRELALTLVELRLQKWEGLAVPGHG